MKSIFIYIVNMEKVSLRLCTFEQGSEGKENINTLALVTWFLVSLRKNYRTTGPWEMSVKRKHSLFTT